ncbi:MAG: Ig-like domain-containing protein, partial [Methanomicrobiales archaeon]|nr:Ig-like domain-containing protein [Methanomicrobiales archaeon]
VPVSAQIGKFVNATGTGGNPDSLIAVVNANFSRSSPGISGTDWRTVHDFTDAEGLVFANSTGGSIGSINFSGGVDLCDTDFAALLDGPITALNIREENVTLDATVPGMAALNTSSRITMSCPGCTAGPAILAGNTVAWYANGSAPDGSPVSALSWDNGTREVTFDAAHWTTYRVHRTGPDILITAPPDGMVTDNASLLLEGTADDPFGVARIELTVNGGSRVMASGTTLWNSTVLLDSGVNTITVWGTDSLECTAEAQIHITRTVPVTPVQRAGGAGGSPAVVPVPTTTELYPPNLPARTVTISSADNRITATIVLAENEQLNSSLAITEEDPSLIELDSPFPNATVFCAFALEPAGTTCEPPAQIVFAADQRMDGALVQVVAQNSESGWETLASTIDGTKITFTTDRFTRYAFIRILPDNLQAGTDIPTPTPPLSGESPEEPMPQKSGNNFAGFLFGIAAITGALWMKGRD